MARYPGARWRPVTRYQPGGSACQPMSRYDGGIDHTYVGSPSSDAAFAHFNTSGTPIPHFMFFRDGTVDQYVDTRFRSSACLDGNPRLITWETADGFPSLWTNGQAPKDTPAMVQAKAKVMVWLHTTHGIPLTRMPSSRPTARGMGWHRLGIDGNYEQPPGQLLGGRVSGGERWSLSAGKTCPTTRRIHQFVDETIPAAVKLAAPPPAPSLPKRQSPRPKLEHPRRGTPEYTGDSYRAIARGAARKRDAIDFNGMVTADDVFVAEHYPLPLHHGFHDPDGKLSRETPITKMTWEEVARLETRDAPPYRIHRMADLTDGATHNGLDVECELKMRVRLEVLQQYLHEVHHPDRVMFKVLGHSRTRSWEWLEAAHKAGRPTLFTCHRPGMRVPRSAATYIDLLRGFSPRWVR